MVFQFNQISLDTTQYRLCVSGNPVSVEPQVFDLLVYLVENRDRVVTRDELLDNLWKGKVVTDAALGVTLRSARKSVHDSGTKQEVIKTLHGRGYQFIADIKELKTDDSVEIEEVLITPESLPLPDKPSIAILPFTNMSGDPEQEYFSDGITEDITTALSYFSGLFVIARNSSFTYKGKSVDARQIASELGVRYLLEGSVRRSGNHIRINGQLIDATTGSHIWAERYDGELDDIFELQDEITRQIVGSIAPRIELAEADRCRGLQTTSLSSYELSLKAKSQAHDALRSGDADGLQKAIDTANVALKQDARNTHALWLLGWTQIDQYLYRWGSDPGGGLNRALKAAKSIVRVDSSNADGHGVLGAAHILHREFDQAIADFTRSLMLNPNAVINLFFAAWGESLAGLTALAREHAELGLRLSPREMDIWLGVAYLALTQASFAEEDFEEAIKWGHLSIQLHSKAPIRRALVIACCAYTGNFQQATQHADEIKTFSPDFLASLLRGDMLLYKMPDHNRLLVDGLRKAGLKE